MIRLEIRTPGNPPSKWSSERDSITVGREEGCELRFSGEGRDFASRRHAVLKIQGGTATLSDLNSANGTFVNGHRLTCTVNVQAGDEISIGQAGPRLRILAIGPDKHPRPTAIDAATRLEPIVGVAVAAQALGKQASPARNRSPGLFLALGLGIPFALVFLIGGWAVLNHRAGASAERETAEQPSAAAAGESPASAAQESSVSALVDGSPPATPSIPINKPASPDRANHQRGPSVKSKTPNAADAARPPAEITRDAIVWIGWESQGFRVPICTAWAASPTKVVTTGQMIQYLDQQRKSDPHIALFAYDDANDKTIRILDLRSHPRYDPDDSGSQLSVHHNVGVAALESPLSATLKLMPMARAKKELRHGAPVRMAGFAITQAMQQKPFDPLNPPEYVVVEGSILGGDLASQKIRLPRRTLDITYTAGLVGAPLVGADGDVVGIVQQSKGKTYGIVAPVIAELLDGG